jgi:hypothetical protein
MVRISIRKSAETWTALVCTEQILVPNIVLNFPLQIGIVWVSQLHFVEAPVEMVDSS